MIALPCWRSFALCLVAAAALSSGCAGCGDPAVVVVVRHGGFRPRCLLVRAHPEGRPAEASETRILLESPEQTGQRRVAVYALPEWGSRLALQAEAHEGACGGAVVARDGQTVSLGSEALPPVELNLLATDPDDDGFISTTAQLPGGDCLEDNWHVRPKQAETLCDGLNDDCDGGVDDTFGVGQPCTASGCDSFVECAPGLPGTETLCPANPRDWYPDLDGDDAGAGAATLSCSRPPGQVPTANDCDDRDALIYPGALEVCDDQDDDCNGVVDDVPRGGSCRRYWPTTPTDFFGVHSRRRGLAWATGFDGGLAILSDAGITDRSGLCGAWNWIPAFADDQDRAYVAGQATRLGYVSQPGVCTSTNVSSVSQGTQMNGIWGYPDIAGIWQIFIVTSGAHVIYWQPGVSPTSTTTLATLQPSGTNLRDIAGIRPYPRITGGWWFDSTGTMLIYPRVFIDRGAGFVREAGADALLDAGIGIRAVAMPRNNLAYAVGDLGTVLEWDGGTWRLLPEPPGKPFLSSVHAFDETHIYVAGNPTVVETYSRNAVYFFNGSTWSVVASLKLDAGTFRDISGVAPDDLWAVGRGSSLWHFVHVP